MKTHHVCYEGTLACSGCNPCPHCLDVVNREVLAQAMRKTTEAIVQVRGPKGVVSVEELDTRNFWAVFFRFYGEAWVDLHNVKMMNDPKVAERAYDLRNIPGFTLTGRYVPPVIAPVVAPPVPVMHIAPPLPVMPASSAVMPLSALAAQAPAPFMPLPGREPLPGTKQINADGSYIQEMDMKSAYPAIDADAGVPWASSFALRDAPSSPAAEAVSSPEMQPLLDGSMKRQIMADELVGGAAEPKLVTAAPADIRRAITAEDIAASATVLDAVPPTPPSANGLAARGS